MTRNPDDRAQPDGAGVDHEFEAIVAGWRREGRVPEWPDEPGPTTLFEPTRPSPAKPRPTEDEHFVPPEPPPLPRIGPPAAVGLALLVTGLVLLISPEWVGVPDGYGLPLGLVGVAAGLGWLVLRLWPDPPSSGGTDRDDGAVL